MMIIFYQLMVAMVEWPKPMMTSMTTFDVGQDRSY